MSRNEINNGGGKTGAGEQHVVKRFFAGLLFATACASAFANVAPTVQMTGPAANAAFIGPATIALSANAADSDGTISKVAFYKGTTLLGTVLAAPYTWNWTNAAAGSYSITAKATDDLGAVTTSAPLTVTVKVNVLPTVSLTPPAPGSNHIAPATMAFSATASDSDGTIAKVSYYRDATLIGSSITAPYTVNWTNAAAGTYSVTARATDDKRGVTTSVAVSVVVNPNVLPTVSLISPVNSATYAAPGLIAMKATAGDTDGTISKVVYYNGTTQIGSATVAPYTFNWANVAIGSYSITARATDNKGGVTVSAPASITVNANTAPTASMTGPASGSIFVATATIALTASAADGDGTIAKVGFYRDGVLIGTSTVAPFKYNWVTSVAGTYSIVARATDDKGATVDSASVSVTVKANVLPSVSLTAPVANASYAAPATINLAATASDTDGTIAKVDFYNGTLMIGSDNTAPYTFSWANVAAGTYSVTARATDDKGAVKTSVALAVKVVAAPVPTVSIASPVNNATYMAPASFTLTANAAVTGDTISKVEYISGGNVVGTALSAPYAASWASIGPGTYTVNAKATGTLGGTATSAPITIVVNANSPPVVSLDATPASAAAPAAITLSATATDVDGSIAKVEFFNGATLLASVAQAPYSHVWNGVAAGSYQITAQATDNLGAVSISAARTVTVSVPIASAEIFYVYTDQINTAREITNAAGVKVWQADPDPFGANLPNENPAGQGQFTYNQRFPGQYFDRETGLHYNYYRDYDPQTGRYVQSDPIGLGGGINTYGYVGGNPLSRTDSLGLFVDEGGIFLVPAAVVVVATSPGWVPLAIAGGVIAGGTAIYLACQPDKEKKCEEIKKKIRDIQAKLAAKRKQLYDDKHNLYNNHYKTGSNPNPKQGTFEGHVDQIIGLQRGLDRALREAKEAGCL